MRLPLCLQSVNKYAINRDFAFMDITEDGFDVAEQ
jgi:hypothetical protein